jgi:hypothetical protein
MSLMSLERRRVTASSLDPSWPLYPEIHDAPNVVSQDATKLLKRLTQLKENNPVSRKYVAASALAPKRSMKERLFDALVAAKVMTSKISMYLDHEQRRALFGELDELLDIDNWHDDDAPLVPASFETYLKFLLFVRPDRKPALGISSDGNLLAAWTDGRNRLSLEMLPEDYIRWVLVNYSNDERESAAGQVQISRLKDRLAPFGVEKWFGYGR